MDHVDRVEPVGEILFSRWFDPGASLTFKFKLIFEAKAFSCFLLADGVVLIDPEYLKERKGEKPECGKAES